MHRAMLIAMSEVDFGSGDVVRRIPVGREPEGVTSSNGEVFVTSEGDSRVDVISNAGHKVVRAIATPKRPHIPAGAGPWGAVLVARR